MIALSRIDGKLSVYRNKKVIIWGAGVAGKSIYHLLLSNGIQIEAFCDNNEKLWGSEMLGGKVKCMAPEVLYNYQHEELVVQIGSTYEIEIANQLKEMQIDNIIFYSEARDRLMNLEKLKLSKIHPEIVTYYIEKVTDSYRKDSDALQVWDYFIRTYSSGDGNYVVLCMPPKTGDHTIQDSLNLAGICCVNFWHSSCHYLDNKLQSLIRERKIKIITAVRDPISQNLSLFFERNSYYYWNRDEYWKKGGDVQKLFRLYIEEENGFSQMLMEAPDLNVRYDYIYPYRIDKAHNRYTSLVQFHHMIEFKKGFGIDLYQYPFDKEKGYSIIKKGEMEVLVFQLEKLNGIFEEMFLRFGMNVKVLNTNYEAEKKWYYHAYKQAKNELLFTREYVDGCYNSKYMKHFYSDEDIQNFRARWEKNISEI